MSFVVIIPDKFDAITKDEAWDPKGERMNNVRRPTRGIQLKEDSYATLRVVKSDGTVIPMANAGARGTENGKTAFSDNYSNFLIQAVTEERIEKQQIVETFGESFIFFYGERPRVISIQGVLLNTFDFNWEAEWWHNYDQFLRGTKCVETGARVYLTYDETMISGYIMATGSTKQAVEKNHVPFQFQMFVTDYVLLSRVGDPSADQTGIRRLTNLDVAYQGRVGYYSGMLSPFRPAAVKKLTMVGGQVGLIGLLGGLVTGIMSSVTSAVSGARAMARELANYANMPAAYLDMFCANPIRVPMGFAGSLVFDDKPVKLVDSQKGSIDTPISYTVFGDNTDEFVALSRVEDEFGANAYYASASVEFGNKLAEPFSELPNARWANAVMKKGYDQFRSWGLVPPDNILSNSLQVLAQNPYGLMLIRGARNQVGKIGAKVSESMNKAIDQAEAKIMPIVAGGQAVLGGIATADRIATIGGVASGMIDRSGMSFDRPPQFGLGQTQNTIGGQIAAGGQQGAGSAPPTIGGNFAPAPNNEGWTNARLEGPVGGSDLTGVQTRIPPSWTRISTGPNTILPANANQLLTNPLANPATALQAFQTLQPVASSPLTTQTVFRFNP